jgi:streptogramin lyase
MKLARALLVTAIAMCGWRAFAQATVAPTNDLPNPYQTVANYFKLPDGRTWGSTSAVEIDKDGRSIWVAERCGVNSCADPATGKMSPLDPVLKFDASGKLVKSFGAGMIAFAHGIFVDRDGNVWVTDANDNRPRPARGAAAGTPPPAAPAKLVGHQVIKFSPDGKVLMTLGKAGVTGDGSDTFNSPSDVLVAPNGDIFVSDGHGGDTNARIAKFSKDGTLIKAWGRKGSGPGEFNVPHRLAMDSSGRLFVADRSNNRIQVFDQDGKFLVEWKQFGRPSGVYIDAGDTIYVADSESNTTQNPGFRRGLRIGSAKDGRVAALIPDPEPVKEGTGPGTGSAAEGVAADADGNVYGAEVDARKLMRYVKK